MNTITKADRKLKDGRIIPMGSAIEITYADSYKALVNVIGVEGFDKPVKINLLNAYKWIKGFKAPPSTQTMEKWLDDGIAQSVTGKRVEPDGYDSDGFPSYLIVLGLI